MKIDIIATQKNASLVQWEDGLGLHRCTLPNHLLKEDLPLSVLNTGIPYGIDWEEFPLTITSAEVARCLRKRGVWTESDITFGGIKAAIFDAMSVEIKTLIEYARRTRQEV